MCACLDFSAEGQRTGPSCVQGPLLQASALSPSASSPRSVLGGHPGGHQAAVGWAWAAAPIPGEELIPFLLQKEVPLISKGGLSSSQENK